MLGLYVQSPDKKTTNEKPRGSNTGKRPTQNISKIPVRSSRVSDQKAVRDPARGFQLHENISPEVKTLNIEQVKNQLKPVLSFLSDAESRIRRDVAKNGKFDDESIGFAIYYLHEQLKRDFDPDGEKEKVWNSLKDIITLQRLPNGDLYIAEPHNVESEQLATGGAELVLRRDRKRKLSATAANNGSVLGTVKRAQVDHKSGEELDGVETWVAPQSECIETEKVGLQRSQEILGIGSDICLTSKEDFGKARHEVAQEEVEPDIVKEDVEERMVDVRTQKHLYQLPRNESEQLSNGDASSEPSPKELPRLSSPDQLTSTIEEYYSKTADEKWSAIELEELIRHIEDIAAEGSIETSPHRCREIARRLKDSGFSRSESAITAIACDYLRHKRPEVYRLWIEDSKTLPEKQIISSGQTRDWSEYEIDQCVRHMRDIVVDGEQGEIRRCRKVSQRLNASGVHRTPSAVYGLIRSKLRYQREDIWNLWTNDSSNTNAVKISDIAEAPKNKKALPLGNVEATGKQETRPYWAAKEIRWLIRVMDQIDDEDRLAGFDPFQEAEYQMAAKGFHRSKLEISLIWNRLQKEDPGFTEKIFDAIKTYGPLRLREKQCLPEEQKSPKTAERGGLTVAWTDIEKEWCARHVQAILGEGVLTGSSIFQEASKRFQASGYYRSAEAINMQWLEMLRERRDLKANRVILAEQRSAMRPQSKMKRRKIHSSDKRPIYPGVWSQFEEDEVVRLVLDSIKQGIRGKTVFGRVSDLLRKSGIRRTPGAIGLRWEHSLRERCGFDEYDTNHQSKPGSDTALASISDRIASSDGPAIVDLCEDMTEVSVDDLVPPGSDSDSDSIIEANADFETFDSRKLRSSSLRRRSMLSSSTLFPPDACVKWGVSSSESHSKRRGRGCKRRKWTEDEVEYVMSRMRDIAEDDVAITVRFMEISRHLKSSGYDRSAKAIEQFWYKRLKDRVESSHTKADTESKVTFVPERTNFLEKCDSSSVQQLPVADKSETGKARILPDGAEDAGARVCAVSTDLAGNSRVYPIVIADKSPSETESLHFIPAINSTPRETPRMSEFLVQRDAEKVDDFASDSVAFDKSFGAPQCDGRSQCH